MNADGWYTTTCDVLAEATIDLQLFCEGNPDSFEGFDCTDTETLAGFFGAAPVTFDVYSGFGTFASNTAATATNYSERTDPA